MNSAQIDSFLITKNERWVKDEEIENEWLLDNGSSGCRVNSDRKNYFGYVTSGGNRQDVLEKSLRDYGVDIREEIKDKKTFKYFVGKNFLVRREMVVDGTIWGYSYIIGFYVKE